MASRQAAAALDLASYPLMLAKPGVMPHAGDWLYEIKYDGYRLLARTGDPALRLREGGEATNWFPELHDSLAALSANCVIDAEGVILDDIGRPDFNAFHERALHRRWYRGARPVALAAFDLLVLRGRDIRDWPIEKRKAALQQLLHGIDVGLLCVTAVKDGEGLYQYIRQLGMEGIVAKRACSVYRGGASNDWRKIKVPGYHRLGKFAREPLR
ncbi:ATP-dependent DNA ligase [Cupriavidus taiwanensis]|uniref:ATP-dependent DNA ligase family profile domain-containing protein n=1 Tax=Cupriavidus taiwanensis TaxID=164546 RepID=A0A7Z7JHT7_9BURK|nr:hypothetical protein [Cupriavidus taiwanensis]SOZ17266.1 conserved hypothetical protein [Cupriavidus taiwanensis]SOZ96407.1 conserved hypothetical protein [Cupriavidus taiwanensis]SPC25648.1 conserved hypothetical protein [Cupriavidus taiwanensis]